MTIVTSLQTKVRREGFINMVCCLSDFRSFNQKSRGFLYDGDGDGGCGVFTRVVATATLEKNTLKRWLG